MQANDPNRCQVVTPYGQCTREAVEGKDRCQVHGGSAKAALKAYLITCKYLGDSPDRHIGADELKSLREEIALTRAMVEKRLNMVQSEAEFIASMPVFQGFMNTIEKLVTSCHAMEVKLGTLIGKAALMTLAQQIVETIASNLQDIPGRDEIVEKISDEIVTLILKAENQ
jgi:hypothetical protein